MAPDQADSTQRITRRAALTTVAGTGAATLAGCIGGSESDGNGDGGDGSTGQSQNTQNPSGSQGTQTLEADGSSTVYPISDDAASYWNANRPASDTEYWPHGEYGIDTEKNLADYWASLYGIEAGGNGEAPFQVTVALSHSGTGVEKVMNGQVDLGNSSGNVEDELPDRDSYENFVDHVVGVDGQPLVVSQEIADAGVEQLTGQQLEDLYKGRIDNWSELGGPDREIQVLGRVKGSGTRTSFVSNVFDDPEADTQVANRFGQNQRLAEAVAQADNAVSYLALAFIDTDGLAPVALEWEGTTYSYQDDENGLDSREYPLSRDLHMYTWEDTSEMEAAFIRMILSDFGQETFVSPNNYFTLGSRRREEELGKLPDTV